MKLTRIIIVIVLVFGLLGLWLYFQKHKNQVTPLKKPLSEITSSKNPLVVVAAGDTTCNFLPKDTSECQDAKVVEVAKKENPSFVLLLGDLQYGGGTPSQYQTFFKHTWGTFGDKLKPALGNHEYETPNAAGYYSFFPNTKPYYSFDSGNWHFIALDSNLLTSDQMNWLATDLEKNTKPCILAYWHHPYFSSGYHGNNPSIKPIWDLLSAHNATLVLNGHDHHYERFRKQNGIREFIVGTGGRSLYGVPAIEDTSKLRTSDHFGFLKLELNETSYTWDFISIDKGSIDKGTDSCSS